MRTVSVLGRLTVILAFALPAFLRAETIDSASSAITVRVFKSGLFAAFAHDHEIRAEGLRGEVVTSGNQRVELRIDAHRLRVLDPELSADKRAEIQATMESDKVLHVEQYPEILFRSTSVSSQGPGKWNVTGQLTLHGQTRAVSLIVEEHNGRYRGSTVLRQKDYGITPVSVMGGTVKVKDEIRIEFDIGLSR